MKIFQKKNIPNMLLVLRMILAVAVVVLIICDCYYRTRVIYNVSDMFLKEEWDKSQHQGYCSISLLMLIAGGLFVLACITDFLDGYLARRFNWVSDFGKFWDPVADKVLVNSVLICFAFHCFIPVWIPVIMIARDVVVDAQRMIAAKKDVVVAANIWGKAKTVLQMIGIIWIFFFCCGTEYAYHPGMWWGIQNTVLYLATIMSVVSGVIYMVRINQVLKNKNAKPKN